MTEIIRLKVQNNEEFLNMVKNHHVTMQLIS